MRMTRTALTLATLVTVGTGITAASAQDRGNQPGNQRGGMPQMLRDGLPQLGEMIPNVTVYTPAGDEIEIHALKGKHKVIVFGCLT